MPAPRSTRRTTYVVAESHAVAKPFLNALDLKRSDELAKFRCFVDESTLLVESRGGTIAAAAAVGYLLGKQGFDTATRLFHIGSCEPRSAAAAALAGRVVLVNQVRDAVGGRCYYPDVLLAHEFPEAAVVTDPDLAIAAPDAAAIPLADRELSGFLAAALTFLAPHQVYCLGVVPSGTISAEGVLDDAMGAILRLVEESGKLLRPAAARIDHALARRLDTICEAMRLTAAQAQQLRRLVAAAYRQGRDVEAILVSCCPDGRTAGPTTKQDRNRRFDELTKRLTE